MWKIILQRLVTLLVIYAVEALDRERRKRDNAEADQSDTNGLNSN